MRFDDFEILARQYWERVPSEYKRGVDGLIVERDAHAHPDQADIYTLGECITESFPSEFGGPDTTRSSVVIYFGSFLRLSHDDPGFDWERELWETVTHELQHHLESLAGADALEDFDYAVDENFKRLDGQPFDPLFFRAGQLIGPARYQVEEDVFLELDLHTQAPAQVLVFDWDGVQFRLPVPSAPADVTFVRVQGGPPLERGQLWLVVVQRRGLFRVLGDSLRARPLRVRESEAVVEAVN